jgi:alpha-galactosidase/6-phospho-beta-glucosidase family protein
MNILKLRSNYKKTKTNKKAKTTKEILQSKFLIEQETRKRERQREHKNEFATYSHKEIDQKLETMKSEVQTHMQI